MASLTFRKQCRHPFGLVVIHLDPWSLQPQRIAHQPIESHHFPSTLYFDYNSLVKLLTLPLSLTHTQSLSNWLFALLYLISFFFSSWNLITATLDLVTSVIFCNKTKESNNRLNSMRHYFFFNLSFFILFAQFSFYLFFTCYTSFEFSLLFNFLSNFIQTLLLKFSIFIERIFICFDTGHFDEITDLFIATKHCEIHFKWG